MEVKGLHQWLCMLQGFCKVLHQPYMEVKGLHQWLCRILQSLAPASDIIPVAKQKKHGDSPLQFLYTIKYYLL